MANPVTHLEKTIAGEVQPVTHLEHVIAEYGGGNVYENLEAGTNILIEETADGKAKISASGEVSSEDTVARADIAAIKDGETLDSFGDVETALDSKADTTDIPTVPITAIQKNGTDITPVSGTVNITVPTQASDINAATATQGGKADTAIQGIKVNSSTVNPDSNKVVNITVPTTAADVSALPASTKYAAALSLTINSSTFVMTGQLKDQNGDNLGTAQTIDLPLESVVVGGSYNSQTKKVVLTLQNGNTIEFSVADLVSGLQTELSASNKLNPAYINYDSSHRAVSDTEKTSWNGKQSALDSSHKLSADLVDDTSATNKFATAAELEQIETNKNNILSLTPTVLKAGFTLSTTWRELPELRITIPANTICRVSAMQTFNAADPTGLILSYGDTDANRESLSNLWAKVENSAGGTVSLETSAIIDNSTSNERTLYVWATAKASGTNFVRAVYEKLA